MSPSDERRDAKRARTHKKIEIKALPVTGLVPVKKHCHTCMCLCPMCRCALLGDTNNMGRLNEYWLDMPDGSKESVATAAKTNRKNDVLGNAVELRNELTVKNYLTCLVNVHGTPRSEHMPFRPRDWPSFPHTSPSGVRPVFTAAAA